MRSRFSFTIQNRDFLLRLSDQKFVSSSDPGVFYQSDRPTKNALEKEGSRVAARKQAMLAIRNNFKRPSIE